MGVVVDVLLFFTEGTSYIFIKQTNDNHIDMFERNLKCKLILMRVDAKFQLKEKKKFFNQ